MFNAVGTEMSYHLFSDSNYIRNRKHPCLQKINNILKRQTPEILNSDNYSMLSIHDESNRSPRNFLTIPGKKLAIVMDLCIVDDA